MQLTTRQLCFIVGGLFPLTKLIVVPSLFAYHMKSDLLLPALILFLLEGLVLLAVLFLSSRTEQTFYSLLEGTFGSFVARAVFFLYGVYFLLSALLPIFEQNLLLRSAFYDTLPSPLVLSSFALLAGYFCMKPLRCLGRMADVVAPISFGALVLLLALSIKEIDTSSFFPLVDFENHRLIRSSMQALPRFLDCAYPLFFLGHYKHEKGTTWKVLLAFCIGCAVVLFALFEFYGIFSVLAPRESSAISKIGRYFAGVNIIGRIDVLLVYLFSLGYLLCLMIPLYLFVSCVDVCIPLRYTRLCVCTFMSIFLFFLYYFFREKLSTIDTFSVFFAPVFLLFSFLLPVTSLFLRRAHG